MKGHWTLAIRKELFEGEQKSRRDDFVRLYGLYVSVENSILANIFLDSRKMGQSIWEIIDQFRYLKIQRKTIDLSTRLMRMTTEFVGFIPKSVMKSIVLGRIL